MTMPQHNDAVTSSHDCQHLNAWHPLLCDVAPQVDVRHVRQQLEADFALQLARQAGEHQRALALAEQQLAEARAGKAAAEEASASLMAAMGAIREQYAAASASALTPNSAARVQSARAALQERCEQLQLQLAAEAADKAKLQARYSRSKAKPQLWSG